MRFIINVKYESYLYCIQTYTKYIFSLCTMLILTGMSFFTGVCLPYSKFYKPYSTGQIYRDLIFQYDNLITTELARKIFIWFKRKEYFISSTN